MASYVKFTLEDGTVVYIESAESPRGSGSLIPSRGSGENVEHAEASFEKSVEAVRKMAASMINGLREGFEEKPSEIAISFGLKASADLGNLVVSRTGMEGNYNVSLRWNSGKKEDEKTNSSGDQKE